jgi:deaminated glutathione amidase
MNKSVVAAIQMVSTPIVAENLEAAGRLVHTAAVRGARFIVLPEYFCILGMHERDKLSVRERDGNGPIQGFLAETARREGVWLVGGCVPIETAAADKVRSACLVYNDQGERVARYDKIHLFGFAAGDESYREANTIEPGSTPLAIDTPFGRVALTICYDVRFPELYRGLGRVDMILVPSAFTATTGRAHWEVLLRARAIENQAYVIAPAQGGHHPNGRQTHGHTMIVDPWGTILAEHASGEAVLTAELDPAVLNRVRSSLPALDHRRL